MSTPTKKKTEKVHRRTPTNVKAFPRGQKDDWLATARHEHILDNRKPATETKRESSEGVSIVSHYSLSALHQLDTICRKMHHVTQVILVGQKTETLDGIENLKMLTELWVVEAQLLDANAVAQCINLVILMLYSNNLSKVPVLGNLLKLKTLWLAGNNIQQIENLEGLLELRDLNFANNKISTLTEGLTMNQKLTTLNIAQNPIQFFQEMVFLRDLKSLTSLYLSDPVYGPAPIARLCNYRSAILLLLSNLAFLDGFSIQTDERLQGLEFYEGKIRRLRTVASHHKEKAIKEIRNEIGQSAKDLKQFKDSTMFFLQQRIDPNLSIPPPGQSMKDLMLVIQRWEAEQNERIRLSKSEVEMRTAELDLELQQVGNITFVRHNAGSQLATICQDLVNRASCSARLGEMRRSAGSTPKYPAAAVDARDEVSTQTPSKPGPSCEDLLLLLTNPDRDLCYGSWPLQLAVGPQISKKKNVGIYVTNCLAAADMCWLARLRVAKDDQSASDGAALAQRPRLGAIVRLRAGIEFRRVIDAGCSGHSEKCWSDDGKQQCKCRCRVYRITGPRPVLVFLIEYTYQFLEGWWSPMGTWWRAPNIKTGPGVLNEAVLTACIGKSKSEWNDVSRINASAKGVSAMGELPTMVNVKFLDLSNNSLSSLGSLYAFCNLRELNLSANNLTALINMRTLPNLSNLDISWNNISQILPIFLCLKTHTPSLKTLMISYNPIEDVLDNHQVSALAALYLPRLEKMDNKVIKPSTRLSYPGSPHPWPATQPHYPLTTKWRAESAPADVLMVDSCTLNASNRLIRALCPSHHWSQIRWADLSGNVLDDSDVGYIFNVMVNIEEISLSRNIIQHLPLNTFQNSTKLIRLDLSSNFITSLASIALYPLSSLRALDLSNNQLTTLDGLQVHSNLTELNAANNAITSVETIQDTLRSLNDLKVLNLYGNPFSTDRPLIKLALFHLKKMEILNGMDITENDLLEARETFGGCLDRDALLRYFSWKDLSHLTELALPRTGLRSVDLPGHLLPSLVSIDFSSNNLTRLWGLHDLPSLQTLDLSDNSVRRLCSVEQDRSEGHHQNPIFPSLTTINLQNNGLKCLAELQMSRLIALKAVFLQRNRLTNLCDIPPWVTGLVMDRNKISFLAIAKFDVVLHLSDLLLEGNAICELAFVKALQSLQRLFIARNRVHDEEELVHLTMLPKLKELTLQGNPVCRRKKHFANLHSLLPGLTRLDGHIIDPNFYLLQRQSYKSNY